MENEGAGHELELSSFHRFCRSAGDVSAAGLTLVNKLMCAVGLCAGPEPPTPANTDRQPMTPSTKEEIMAAMSRLESKKDAWLKTSTKERAEMLSKCRDTVVDVANDAVGPATDHHGSYGGGVGDEMGSWLPVADSLANFEHAMASEGQPKLHAVSQRWNDTVSEWQFVVDVLPREHSALLFAQSSGEVWLLPGKEPSQGAAYRRKKNGQEESSVAVILGAGNQVSITVLDILHMLLVEDRVVIVKMNPINSYFGPYIHRVLGPFFERGFVEMVYGGAEEGSMLCCHSATSAIHLTGEISTFNKIVWGSQESENKKRVLSESTEVTGELGNVTPFIIVPGDWTDAEITLQAKSVLSGLYQNSGHNCASLEILVTSKHWPLREKFLQELRSLMKASFRQAAWYPGSSRKYQAFQDRFANHNIEEFGQDSAEGGLPPWMFVAGLSPSEADTQTENWCGVFQEVCLDVAGDHVEGFLDQAATFANSCAGTLTCSVFIKPSTQARCPAAFDRFLERLEFGNIVMNAPAMLGFALTTLSWGAFPGNPMNDIGSGNCALHNTFLLDHPQKSILRCPWIFKPQPFWFYTLTNKANVLGKCLLYLVRPSISSILQVIPSVLQSRS